MSVWDSGAVEFACIPVGGVGFGKVTTASVSACYQGPNSQLYKALSLSVLEAS